MRKIKKFSWLLLLVGLLFLVGCQKQHTSKKADVVIGVDDTFLPMGFRDEKNQLTGYDIDLAKAVFKKLGKTVAFQTIDWSMKEAELKNGTIDLIWNGYSVTPSRKKQVAFSNPYLENQQVLVVRKDDKIKTIANMKNKILGLQEGSSGYDVFESYPEVLKNTVKNQEGILYSSFNEGFLDLKVKRIDGLLMDEVYAEYYISKMKGGHLFTILKTPYEGENFAIGARKDDTALLEKIDETMKELEKEGTLGQIKGKWFGEKESL